MTSSNKQGEDFEHLVGCLLNLLMKRHPNKVEVRSQPRLELHNSLVRIPDFELVYKMPHMRLFHLIECQARQVSSRPIVDKIYTMKGLSRKNIFFFVYEDDAFLKDPDRLALEKDGIAHLSLAGFISFLYQLDFTLEALRRVGEPDFTQMAIEELNAARRNETGSSHVFRSLIKELEKSTGEENEGKQYGKMSRAEKKRRGLVSGINTPRVNEPESSIQDLNRGFFPEAIKCVIRNEKYRKLLSPIAEAIDNAVTVDAEIRRSSPT